MTVFVCVDDRNGMVFNNRRQSRDSAVIKKIIEMVGSCRLLMNKYSSKLFKGVNVTVLEDYMDTAQSNDFCFVEDPKFVDYSDKITKIVIFKWNKSYPYDGKMELDLARMTKTETFDFVGTSHDRITCEVWKK